MSEKPPPKCLFNFSEEDAPQAPIGADENIKVEVEEDIPEVADEEPIKIEEKEKIVEKEIFNDYPDNLAVVPDNLKGVISEKPITEKKPKKARKPMSEEHKQKLALAREKAMASRKAKAEERRKMKELEKEEKELLKTQKIKKVQKLKEEVESPPQQKVMKESERVGVTTFTKKDLEEAQLEAIMKYDALRKKRKEEKKQQQVIEDGKKKMLEQINRATGNTYRYRDGSNRFDGCY